MPKFQKKQRASAPADSPYRTAFEADTTTRIRMVREGVPAHLVVSLSASLGVARDTLYTSAGLSRSTIDRKIAQRATLAAGESERVLRIAALVGQVEQMHAEFGSEAADFDAARWLGVWLQQPNPALGGQPPIALLDTAIGVDLVSRVLHSMQTGAYW